jgi:hypothetical protein
MEMTVVMRPFVLDFAGAYLDFPPEFPDATWAEWEIEKREQFGPRWTMVQAIMGALEELDIHMVDVSPAISLLWINRRASQIATMVRLFILASRFSECSPTCTKTCTKRIKTDYAGLNRIRLDSVDNQGILSSISGC